MSAPIKKIETQHAPAPLGPYSQGVAVSLAEGQLLFVSGQLPMNKAGELIAHDIKSAAHLVFKNISAILHAAGGAMSDVVKVEIFLKDLNHFKEVNAIYSTYFPGPIFPARQTVEVSKLPLDAPIEVSCVALIKPAVIKNTLFNL